MHCLTHVPHVRMQRYMQWYLNMWVFMCIPTCGRLGICPNICFCVFFLASHCICICMHTFVCLGVCGNEIDWLASLPHWVYICQACAVVQTHHPEMGTNLPYVLKSWVSQYGTEFPWSELTTRDFFIYNQLLACSCIREKEKKLNKMK